MLRLGNGFLLAIALSPADAGGGGGDGGGDGGDGGGTPAGDGGQGGDASAGKHGSLSDAAAAAAEGGGSNQNERVELPAWAPQGLPPHMLGQNEQDTLGNVFKAFQGFQRESSERGAVPEEATGYTFEPTDAIKPFAEDFANDPVFADVQKAAQEAGITDKQFAKFLPRVLEGWLGNDELGLAKPVDFNAEVMKLVPDGARGLDEAGQRAAAGKRINDALAWVNGVKEQSGFSADKSQNEAIAEYLVAQLGDDARGIHVLEFIQRQSSKQNPALGGQGGGGLSDSALDARLNDPRGNPDSPQFDRGFAAETDRLFQERYGNKRVA